MSIGNIEDIVGAGDVSIGGALDPATGALPVQRVDDPRFDDNPNPVLVNATNLSVGTHNFPDDNGVAQLGQKSLSFAGTITGNTIDFQVWGYNGTQWIQVTQMFVLNNGTAPPGTLQSSGGTPLLFGIHIDHFPYQKWRATLEVATSTTNSATVGSYQKPI